VSINIDRSDAGNKDEIEFILKKDENLFNLKFMDVYQANLNLNFGVVSEETIREAYILDENDLLNEIKNKWSKIGVSISDLKCYLIETNSTSSNLLIYSIDFVIKKLKAQ
jgi:hypothetical protein